MISTLALAVGVSADAFTVSIGNGARQDRHRTVDMLLIAFLFAAAETVALLLGWSLGHAANAYVAAVDHWIAFGILGGVGAKMIWESLVANPDSGPAVIWPTLALTAIGTSVDTFAVGAVLALMEDALVPTALAIAAVTFVMACLGMLLGRAAGTALGRPAGAIGGVILIAIGSVILVQHLGVWA
ncbi:MULTISPECIES: manganese efflux pump MntP family protein [Thalassobaculum]|uniref:Putative manganese efflux pump MntP n=1 Tax=Thalassobaculum litoreum DSM 18839 TaxID=1123362 RepID=A0A8G2F032_9PROT|nr:MULTISPECIES: manganese efflux pump MntP family protein [Thalassobaculum]SDG31644.1 Putative Mn2+ efflux pump MntP [Thalassobaculum litoreum DSM 18839]